MNGSAWQSARPEPVSQASNSPEIVRQATSKAAAARHAKDLIARKFARNLAAGYSKVGLPDSKYEALDYIHGQVCKFGDWKRTAVWGWIRSVEGGAYCLPQARPLEKARLAFDRLPPTG